MTILLFLMNEIKNFERQILALVNVFSNSREVGQHTFCNLAKNILKSTANQIILRVNRISFI